MPIFFYLIICLVQAVEVAGVQVETDPRLPWPVARPQHLSLIASGEFTIDDLIRKGTDEWYDTTPFRDKPFAIPDELLKPVRLTGRIGTRLSQHFPFPLPYDNGSLIGLPSYRNDRGHQVSSLNCASCHTGQVNGMLIPGIGNKYYDEGQTFKLAENLLKSGHLSTNPTTRAEAKFYWDKFDLYRKLLFTGCKKTPLGTHTGTRIEQVGSGYLTSLEQFKEPNASKKYPCGGLVKVQPLNILKFKNIAFSDGKLNSTWNSRWPTLTLLDKTDTIVDELAEDPAIQALDAYVYYGTRSPSWQEVMKTPINKFKSQAGYKIFHRPNACASCHGTYSEEGMLKQYKVQITPINVIKTAGERTLENLPQIQEAYYRNGPRRKFFEPVKEVGYVPHPLCSTFLNYPYLHTGAVANLFELLQPDSLRVARFWVGDFVDKERVGFSTVHKLVQGKVLIKQDISRSDLQGHSGLAFGTELAVSEKSDLIEYLKTLRCPEGP